MASERWSKSRINKNASRKKAKKKFLPNRPGDNNPITKEIRQKLAHRKYKSKYVRKYGLNIGQIAKKLRVSVGTVSKLSHKAITKLLKGVA